MVCWLKNARESKEVGAHRVLYFLALTS